MEGSWIELSSGDRVRLMSPCETRSAGGLVTCHKLASARLNWQTCTELIKNDPAAKASTEFIDAELKATKLANPDLETNTRFLLTVTCRACHGWTRLYNDGLSVWTLPSLLRSWENSLIGVTYISWQWQIEKQSKIGNSAMSGSKALAILERLQTTSENT